MNTYDVHVLQRQHALFFSKRFFFSLVCVFLLSLSVGFIFVHAPQKAHAANWVEIWNDEFNGAANTGVDSQWQYDLGTGYPCSGCAQWGTGEIETMTNSTSNVYQDGNGHLVIKALNNNGSWTSGRIETVNSSFAAPAGGELEVTASLQQPNVSGQSALGYWPAFWMLGSAFRGVYTNWPSVGEIDMMEDINGLSREYATLHCGVASGGPCNEKNGLGSGPVSCSGCQTAYHTYTAIIDRSSSPEQIRWYLDGNQIFSVSSSQMDATTWANAVDHSFFIILDLAMGGAFPNGVCGCTSPTSSTASGASLNVDYVRVYTSSGAASTPTATPTSGGGTTYYHLVNRNSGLVMDVSGASTSAGANVIQWPNNGGFNQEWSLQPAGNGYYYLVNRNSGLVMDVSGASTSQGANVIQWSNHGGTNQQWSLQSTGDGYYRLVNRNSGLVADVNGASTSQGAQVIQWPNNGGFNQEWSLVQV